MGAIALEIAAGLFLLAGGGEVLVRGAIGLAKNFGVSKLLIGLVLVGFGTSMPELATSMNAALIGAPGIAVGNVIGSNIANILLILGLTAVLRPIACEARAFRRDGPMLGLATLLCFAVALTGTLDRTSGLVFVAVLLGYTIHSYRTERRDSDPSARLHRQEADLEEPTPTRTWVAVLFALGGMAMMIGGAALMVEGSVALARLLGTSETLIGLTLVAVGTSLPELSVSIIAAMRGQTDLAFGNIVGSNIFNSLGILGATAAVTPLAVPSTIIVYDLWIMVAATMLLVVFAVTDWTLSRREGLVFLAAYGGYLVLAVLRAAAVA